MTDIDGWHELASSTFIAATFIAAWNLLNTGPWGWEAPHIKPFYSAPPTYMPRTALGIEVVEVGLPSRKAVGVGLPSWPDWIAESGGSELECRVAEI